MSECIGCRLEWPVIMPSPWFCDSSAHAFHAVPLSKFPAGRAWLAAGKPPCLAELIECTRPRGPVLTLLLGGLP